MNRAFVCIAAAGRTWTRRRCDAATALTTAGRPLTTAGRPMTTAGRQPPPMTLSVVHASSSSSSSTSPSVGRPTTDPVTFVSHENMNAHNTMVNDPTYAETVVDPADVHRQWPTVTSRQFHELIARDADAAADTASHGSPADRACDDFLKITAYATGKDYCLTGPEFAAIRDRLTAALPAMSDGQLMAVLRLIPLWNVRNAKEPAYHSFWSRFDQECIVRHRQWSLNKLLLFMDYWYLMRLSRLSNFVWVGTRKLARKPSRLTPKQLVQMMFYANTSRKFLPTLPMYDIEQEIYSYYNDFNIKELGIVALGFFKTQTPIRNQELVRKLYSSVINDIENIRSLELAAFLKIFRYCSKHKNADSMYKFMEVLVDKVDEVELVCCVHMALLGTNLLIKHERLLQKISQRMVDEISQARIKDIERITLSLSMLNYNPQTMPCIFETIVKELRKDSRKIDFEQHTKCYIFTLSYLAINNIFPYDCISKSLEAENLKKCFGKKLCKFNVPRDILTLNNSMLIECPDYSGPLLPDALTKSCNEHLTWHIPTTSTFQKITSGDKNFLKVYRELVRSFQNESYLHVCYPLPHHPKSNILFCIGSDGKPVIIPETIKNNSTFDGFNTPPELGKWFAVLTLVRNSVLYYSQEYNGLTMCKIRQLKKLGYEPIVVTTSEMENDCQIQTIMYDKLKMHGINLD